LIDPFEEQGIKLVASRAEIAGLLSVGDDGVRQTLKNFLTKANPAPDLISVTKEGKVVITEIKGGQDIATAVKKQLKSVVDGFKSAGYLGDIDYVEVIVDSTVKQFKEANWDVVDGHLVNILTNKRVEVPGYPGLFVRATRMDP
jgi:nitrous oxide reductase